MWNRSRPKNSRRNFRESESVSLILAEVVEDHELPGVDPQTQPVEHQPQNVGDFRARRTPIGMEFVDHEVESPRRLLGLPLTVRVVVRATRLCCSKIGASRVRISMMLSML